MEWRDNICVFVGCDRPVEVKKVHLCWSHYAQYRRAGQDMSALRPVRYTRGRPTLVTVSCAWCGGKKQVRPSYARRNNFCSTEHHNLWQKNRPQRHRVYKGRGGGFAMNANGYWYVSRYCFSDEELKTIGSMWKNSQRILHSRAVMALHIGRPLESSEQVHHFNGDTADDSIGNLRLLEAGAHQKRHAEVLQEMNRLRRLNEDLQRKIARLEQLALVV